jgi:phosphoglycolate phosphatase-like HAD superfamily hydrolase
VSGRNGNGASGGNGRAPHETTLVLFDIDGTLLWSDGAGRAAMQEALTSVFGTTGDPSYRYDGKTDRQIVRELMRGAGHGDPHIDARMPALFDLYLDGLRRELATGERRTVLLPGVRELLDALEASDGVVVGLLTGNLEDGARAKLGAAGIDFDRFRICAFGSDHEHRPELPAVAQRRARELLGVHVEGERIVVVGDTPADIDCGREIGARAIAVATGRYGVEELRAHEPAAVFEDLTDTAAVVEAILRG